MELRIQSYLRAVASHQRQTMKVGPFLTTFTQDNSNPFLNYALPADGATPSVGDVVALIDTYEYRERMPRLEYIARLAPAVEPALLAAGFVVEWRLPLMTCYPGGEQPVPPPAGIEFRVFGNSRGASHI